MAELHPVLSDLVMVESPRWHDDRLVFSDWGAGEIVALRARRHPPRHSADRRGMACRSASTGLPDGRLLVVTQDGPEEPSSTDGTLTAYADLAGLSPITPGTTSWSTAAGNAYVNNINLEFGGRVRPRASSP